MPITRCVHMEFWFRVPADLAGGKLMDTALGRIPKAASEFGTLEIDTMIGEGFRFDAGFKTECDTTLPPDVKFETWEEISGAVEGDLRIDTEALRHIIENHVIIEQCLSLVEDHDEFNDWDLDQYEFGIDRARGIVYSVRKQGAEDEQGDVDRPEDPNQQKLGFKE